MHLTRRNELIGLLVIAAAAGLGYYYFNYMMVPRISHQLSATIVSIEGNEIKATAVHLVDESSKTSKEEAVTIIIDSDTIFSKKVWNVPEENEAVKPPTRIDVDRQTAMKDLQNLIGNTISVRTEADTYRQNTVTAERVDYSIKNL